MKFTGVLSKDSQVSLAKAIVKESKGVPQKGSLIMTSKNIQWAEKILKEKLGEEIL